MSGRGDEVEAAVDASVRDAFLPGNVHLLLQELLVLLIDVLLNGLPARGGREKADGGPRRTRPGSSSYQGQESGSHIRLISCLQRALGDLLIILPRPPWMAFPVIKGRNPLGSEPSD